MKESYDATQYSQEKGRWGGGRWLNYGKKLKMSGL